jgi:exopolysaccharide biosynthesis polyprenyl glycosylphosphotransferase
VAHTVDGITLMFVGIPKFDGPQLLIKTAVDKVVSSLALILLAPLMLVIAALVRLSDGGPAFFVQRRVGRDFKEFTILKFRTMVPDAEALRPELEAKRQPSTVEPDRGPLFKMYDDPRVTRLGRILRRASLDELPQLINIFRGDMSLVGPRPPLPSEVKTYSEDEDRRMLIRPGLTGLWQVSGRSNLSWEESVRHDLYYVDNWSMTMDIIIIFRTVTAVISGRGAA